MNKFNFNLSTSIRYGWGRINEIGKVVSRYGKQCLLVTVKPFPAMALLFDKVKIFCNKADVEVIHFDGVVPSATTDSINQASELVRESKIDVVLGVGGGSSMDTAKSIAVGATHEGDIWDYRLGHKRIQGKNVLPIITVPTTAGTGAEVTSVAVVKNDKDKQKNAIADWSLSPKVCIGDPELTLTLPPYLTATTGFDTFCHLFESYLNKYGSHLTSLMALDTLKLVIKLLPIAIKDPNNKEARDALLLASTIGGICITNIGTTLPHSIDMSIGSHHPKISHGESLAIVYPDVNRWTWKSAIPKYAVVGRLFNSELIDVSDEVAAERACDEIDNFIKKIGLWISLEDKDVSKDDLKAIVNDSMNVPNYSFHPKVATLKDIDEIVRKSHKK